MSDISSIKITNTISPLKGVMMASVVIGIISIFALSVITSQSNLKFLISPEGSSLLALSVISTVAFGMAWHRNKKHKMSETINFPEKEPLKFRKAEPKPLRARLEMNEKPVVKAALSLNEQIEMLMPVLAQAVGNLCLAMTAKWHNREVTEEEQTAVSHFFDGTLQNFADLVDKSKKGISETQGLKEEDLLPRRLTRLSVTMKEFPAKLPGAPTSMTVKRCDLLRFIIHAYNVQNFEAVERLLELLDKNPQNETVEVPISPSPKKCLNALARVHLPAANLLLHQGKVNLSYAHACKLGFMVNFLDFYPENFDEAGARAHDRLLTEEFEHNRDKEDIDKQVAFLVNHKQRPDLLQKVLNISKVKHGNQPRFVIPVPFSLFNVPVKVQKDAPVIGGMERRVIQLVNLVGMNWFVLNTIYLFFKNKLKEANPIVSVMLQPLYEMVYPGIKWSSQYRKDLLKLFTSSLPELQEFLLEQSKKPDPIAMIRFFRDYCQKLADKMAQ